MKCEKCQKRFNGLANNGICPYCGEDHYKYFKISKDSKKGKILDKLGIELIDDEDDDEFDSLEIWMDKAYKRKVEEDKSYEEFDSYNWIDSKNKSKWEDFDDEDDE